MKKQGLLGIGLALLLGAGLAFGVNVLPVDAHDDIREETSLDEGSHHPEHWDDMSHDDNVNMRSRGHHRNHHSYYHNNEESQHDERRVDHPCMRR